jgi:hypothetical protein
MRLAMSFLKTSDAKESKVIVPRCNFATQAKTYLCNGTVPKPKILQLLEILNVAWSPCGRNAGEE